MKVSNKKNHSKTKKGAAAAAASAAASTSASTSTVVAMSPEQLWMELQEHNMFFDDLVDMIPSKLYVSQANQDDYNPSYETTTSTTKKSAAANKYYKGQSKDSKETRRALNKQSKRMKLDPSTHETTTQLKQRLEEEQQQQQQRQGGANLLPLGGGRQQQQRQQRQLQRHHQDDDDSDGDSDGDSDDVDSDDNNNTNTSTTRNTKKIKNKKNSDTVTVTTNAITTSASSSRIEELRAKIQAKLAEKRGQRPSDPATVSKIAARRAERKKRKHEMKDGRKKDKKDNNNNSKNNRKSAISRAEDKASGSSSSLYKMMDSRNSNVDDPAADLARVDFGRLAGLNTHDKSSRSNNYNETNKALKNLSKTKNLEKMLADAEAKKQRLKELQQSTDDDDRQKAKNIQWGDAIREASGERVKDDPAKIKKLMKRKAVSKAKSAKAWKSRMEQTQQKMQERQKIRTHNLSKRKQGGAAGANLSSKRINSNNADGAADGGSGKEKKPRLNRPGFEGRKLEFLNPKKSQ
mmetsp:Transcript_59038/g.144457  ORF Transcript_59038/g.144457 Transcript_59038/m.144457 type:complete len:519 (-) Transcript_59038:379-1935(-)